MRKASKMFVGLALAGMLLTGCDFPNNSNANSTAGVYEQQQIYQLYVANGGTKNYEEWLESVRGADGSTFLAGANDPAATDGKNGDIYVNTTTWDFFLKISGAWNKLGNLKGAQGDKGDKGDKGDQGEKGDKGDQGEKGDKGDKGDQGEKGDKGDKGDKGEDGFDGEDGAPGADGKDGKDGENGASVLTGSGKPAADLGKDGDSYIDIATWDFYTKNNGKWTKVANLTHELTWAPDVAAAMNKYLGFQLPYANYDEDSMTFGYYSGYESYYGIGLFYIYDESEDYSLANYGAKLEAAGFEQGGYYTSSSTNYIKTIGEDVYEVSFGFDDGNCINVYMPPYVPPYDADYFLGLGFAAQEGWPKAAVDAAMGEDVFAGVNLDATWYVKAGNNNGEYYYALLGGEGLHKEAIYAQAAAAGYVYHDEYDICFLPADPANPEFDDDNDAYVQVLEKDGWSYIKFFGATLPYSDEDFLDNGYTAVDAYPADVFALAYNEENQFDGVNLDGQWFVKYSTSNGSGSTVGKTRTSGSVATKGNFVAEFVTNIAEGGFEYYASWGDYELEDDYYAYMYVKFERGYTIINFYGSWKDSGEPLDLPKVEEVNDKVVEFFADKDIELTCPEYEAASEDAYYEVYAANELRIYGSSSAEMGAFVEALAAANWTTGPGDYTGDYAASFGDTGATLKVENWYSYIKIKMSVEEPIVPPELLDEFPLEDVNAFLTAYDMGFTFTAEQAAGFVDVAGEGFQVENDIDEDGYHYFIVSVSGNQQAAWEAVLVPVITAAGYYESEDYGYCNDDIHVARVSYNSSYDYTALILWE